MNKLVSIGDCVVDMLPSAPKSMTYTAKAGGAPTNVAACVAMLGADAYYLGKMANDNFGRFLLDELKKYNIKTDFTVISDDCKTGIVFVDQKENGDREFFFHRDTPADENLYPEEIPDDLLKKGDILHFCSIALVPSPTKQSHVKVIEQARKVGATVSFDVNLRKHLWKDHDALRRVVIDFLPYADVVKVTDDELEFVTGKSDIVDGVKDLFDIAVNAKLVFVTKGECGSSTFDRESNRFDTPAYVSENGVVDTTGAGDCFIGSIIYKLLKNETDLTINRISNAVDFASKACACVISKKGAMNAMPTLEEVDRISI